MSVWTVKPETVKIDLIYKAPDGTDYPFWIKVKKQLTIGEQRAIMTAGWRGHGALSEGQPVGLVIDWKSQTFARTETYLVDWSLTDDNAVKIPVSRDSVEALDPAVFALIEDALNKHVEAADLERRPPNGSSKS